jgi:hypothetical protein
VKKMLRKERSQNLGVSTNIDVNSLDFDNYNEIEKLIEQDWLIEEMHLQFEEFRAINNVMDLSVAEKRIKTFLSYFLKNIEAEDEYQKLIGLLGLEQLYLLVVELLERVKST